MLLTNKNCQEQQHSTKEANMLQVNIVVIQSQGNNENNKKFGKFKLQREEDSQNQQ